MLKTALVAHPALPPGRTGRDGAYWIEPAPEGHLLHALVARGSPEAGARLAAIAEDIPFAVRPSGPQAWFVVGDNPLSLDVFHAHAAALRPDVALSDQSHGRMRLSIFGPLSRTRLATGCGVDFSDRAFPLGHSAPTLFGHVGVHVTRTGSDGFELIVLRSFAPSLWAELCGRERA